jgi:hypothetical protein
VHHRAAENGAFIQGNLKQFDWLNASMIAIDNNNFPAPANQNGPLKTNVLSQEVKFDVISTGTVSPGWKLTTATVNQSENLLSATRDRTQDLSVIFGPMDPSWSLYEIDATTRRVKIDPRTGKPIIRRPTLAPVPSGMRLEFGLANSPGA